MPLTTTSPAAARSRPSERATERPYDEHARALRRERRRPAEEPRPPRRGGRAAAADRGSRRGAQGTTGSRRRIGGLASLGRSSPGIRYESASATCAGSTDPEPRERGDRPSHPRDPCPSTPRQRQPVDRAREELRCGVGSPRRVLAEHLVARVDDARHEPRSEGSPGGAASSTARGRGIATARSKRSSKRARQLLPVRGKPLRRARALDGRDRRAAARAHVHRADELETGRKDRVTADTRDRDDAVLERLAQRLEDGARELGKLVQEEDAAMPQ